MVDSGSRDESGKGVRRSALSFGSGPALHLVLNGVNEVDCTEDLWIAPRIGDLSEPPDVDDVRPKRCRRCRRPARDGGRIILHGHGKRSRSVVVVAALEEDPRPELGECWQRRYRCTACKAVVVVLPRGVMPRYLYSAGAIVMAFFLTTAPPTGDGRSDADAYARQGMYQRTCWNAAEPYRWRSIDRWTDAAKRWWPTLTGRVTTLLIGFIERSGTGGRRDTLAAALGAHVQWGEAM